MIMIVKPQQREHILLMSFTITNQLAMYSSR